MTAQLSASSTEGVALIVDLETTGRRTLAWELSGHGYEVCAADESEEALDLARRLRPRLVVLELRLRSGSVFDLLPALRRELPEAKLVILTSYGSVASAVRALRLGATNYLCKPARAAQILWAANDASTHDVLADVPAADDTLTLDQAIWEYIHQTLEASGSISEAARRLGLFRQSLKRMISKYRPGDARPAPAPVAARR
jgi:two-component system, response regulator RegA